MAFQSAGKQDNHRGREDCDREMVYPETRPTNKDAMKAWFEAQPKIAKPRLLDGILRAPGRTKQLILGIDEEAVMGKVAAILGNNITAQKLIDAFKKAAIELKNEDFFKALDKAVTDGKITADEAKQIKTWWGRSRRLWTKLYQVLELVNPGRAGWGRCRVELGVG